MSCLAGRFRLEDMGSGGYRRTALIKRLRRDPERKNFFPVFPRMEGKMIARASPGCYGLDNKEHTHSGLRRPAVANIRHMLLQAAESKMSAHTLSQSTGAA